MFPSSTSTSHHQHGGTGASASASDLFSGGGGGFSGGGGAAELFGGGGGGGGGGGFGGPPPSASGPSLGSSAVADMFSNPPPGPGTMSSHHNQTYNNNQNYNNQSANQSFPASAPMPSHQPPQPSHLQPTVTNGGGGGMPPQPPGVKSLPTPIPTPKPIPIPTPHPTLAAQSQGPTPEGLMPLPHGFIPPSAPTPATATFKPAPVTQQPQPAPEGMIATPHGFVPALTRQHAAVPAPASTTVPASREGVGSKVVMGADGIPHITTRPPSTSSSVTLTTHRSATTTTTAATTTTGPMDHQQQYPPRSVGPSGLGQGQDTSSPSDFFANVSLDGGASTTTTNVNGGSMFGEQDHNHNHPTATTAVATAATAEVTATGGGRGLSEDGMGGDSGSHALDAFAAGPPGAGLGQGSGPGQGLGPEHVSQITRDRSTSSSNTSMGYTPSHPPHPHASSMPPSFTTTTNNNNNTTSATTTSTYTKGSRQKHGRPMCATVCFGFGGKVAIMMPQVILSSQTHHSLSSYPLSILKIHPLNQLRILHTHVFSIYIPHTYHIPSRLTLPYTLSKLTLVVYSLNTPSSSLALSLHFSFPSPPLLSSDQSNRPQSLPFHHHLHCLHSGCCRSISLGGSHVRFSHS